ncbi:MAG: PrpR N-terminal domain-containing protein [Lactobacillaceae bacterium]
MFHFLGILPYAGLSNAVKRVGSNFKNADIDNFVGDLENGIIVLNSKDLTDYDAIISRGGTSKMITQVTQLPVIDIGVSKYDILHAIQITQKLNKIAIVGFSFLINKAQNVINDFQRNIDLFTINSELEARQKILDLQKQNYDIVIGDMVTVRVANSLNFKSLLISSDDENIENALNNALNIVQYRRKNHNLECLLNNFLKTNSESIVILDSNKNIQKQFNLPHKQKILPHIKKRVELNKLHNEIFKSQGKYYLIRQDKQKPNFLYINNLAYYNQEQPAPFTMNKLEKAMFTAAFKAIYSKEEHQTLETMNDDDLPVIISGSDGTGKRFILNKVLQKQKNVIKISPMNTNINHLLDSNHINNSPLLNSKNTIVFDKFEDFDPQAQSLIIEFINQTLLFKRNKLFFTLEKSKEKALLNLKKVNQIFHSVQLRSVKKIDSLTANSLITLLINEFNQNFGKNVMGLTDIAFDWLIDTYWSNNLRQILFTLLNAYHIAEKPYINIKELKLVYKKELIFENTQSSEKLQSQEKIPFIIDFSKKPSLEDLTNQLIKIVLVRNDYNKSQTAAQLKISRTTLWRILNKNNFND